MSVKKPPMSDCGSRTFGMFAICMGMLLSSPAHALSLGGIQVKSALDEPLRAEITLNSADAETLKSLEVTLGSQDDFARAAVPRSEFLQALEFSVSRDGGNPVVLVTTEVPVKEPFLHFLVAAEWSGGKLVREYTGLLDPPLYTAESPAAVETPAMEETSASMASGDEPSEPASSMEPTESGDVSTGMSGSSMATGTGRSAEYGPTREGDTLWSIASRLDTSGLRVNVFQIMIALLRENPDAFIDNNINRLKTGQILRLQDISDIADVRPQDATAVYTAQLEEWQSYKTGIAASDGSMSASGDTAGSTTTADAGEAASGASGEQSGSQESTAAQPDSAGAAAGASDDDEVLRIVKATLDESQQSESAGAGADRSGEIASLRGQIATLEESLESRNLENQELQERVRLLESQLENAQRLIEIESQDLAAAQQQAQESQQAEEEAAMAAAEESQADEQSMAASGDEAQTGDSVDTQTDASMVSVESADSGGQPDTAEQTGETQTGQQAATTAASAGDASESAQSSGRVRKVVNRPPQDTWWSGLPDMLFSSWMWMVGAGVGVLVLVLGLLMFLRRRQSIAEFEESILSGSALDSYSETTDTAGNSASDTSFLSDFGTAGMGTMQADEVDPLAEAEVYLAYGRDEQAEEVLKEAARRDPERSEIKLKLLEIYKQRNDVKSFETIAEELYPASEQEDPAIWRQVTAMGRELNPGNPLFQGEADSPDDTRSPTPEARTGTGNAPATAHTTPRAPVPAGASDDTGGLDFDLGDFGGDDSREANAETVKKEGDDLGLDLDLDADTGTKSPLADTEKAAAGRDDNTLNIGDEFLQKASRNVDPSAQPFPEPDQQTDLDRELERLAGEREAASTQVRPAVSTGEFEGGEEPASREVSWETAESDAGTLDFPSSDTSEIDFDLDLDESSIPAESDQAAGGAEEPSVAAPGSPDSGDGLMEFESDNIPPEETWAGPSSDAAPGSGDDALSYSPEEDVQSSGAPQYNEAETKLDLARAYLDMGDKVGARSIIDEVMREGDPAQRDRAAELASQL